METANFRIYLSKKHNCLKPGMLHRLSRECAHGSEATCQNVNQLNWSNSLPDAFMQVTILKIEMMMSKMGILNMPEIIFCI